MKSLFSRLRGAHTPPPSRSPSASQSNEDKENLPIPPNPPSKPGKSSQPVVKSAPVSLRSSTPLGPIDSQTSSSSSGSTRPRSTQKQSDGESPPNVEIWDSAGGGRARTVSAGEAGGKKVTFRSPAPTPSINTELEEVALLDSIIEAQSEGRGSKTDNRRNTSASPSKKPSAPAKLSRPQPTSRSSPSQSFSTRPRFSSRQSLRITARKASLPPLPTRSDSFSQSNQRSPLRSSIVSPAPSNASLERTSARSYLPPPNSWGEMADEELIANLGPRERTRQEVLWEIVSSEERSVRTD